MNSIVKKVVSPLFSVCLLCSFFTINAHAEELTSDLVTDDVKNISEYQVTINPDIYAWITIPGVEVDFPILQSEEDDYYLLYKEDGSYGLPGSIYTNKIDGKDFSGSNTVVYGHNMRSGAYFGQLHRFEDNEFLQENHEIYIYLSDKKLTYDIILVSAFNDYELHSIYDFTKTEEAFRFLDNLIRYDPAGTHTSIYNGGIDWSNYNQLLTLSTCTTGDKENRFLLVAKLNKVEMYATADEPID